MTRTTIELEPEQIDAIVVEELKLHYSTLDHDVNILLEREANGTLPPHKVEDLRNNTRTLNHIEGVLSFYLSDRDFNAWLDSYNATDEDEEDDEAAPVVSIVDIAEHDDGSATVLFEFSPEMMRGLASKTLREAIIEAAEKFCPKSTGNAKDGE